MKNRTGEKVKLASLDELLGVVNEESAMEIEISKIHAFKNHPFKVLDDEKMQDLVDSVKLSGVLTPVLLRVDQNEEYEMISGHRRLHAAKLAGLTTIPAIVINGNFIIMGISIMFKEKAPSYYRHTFIKTRFSTQRSAYNNLFSTSQ